MAPPLLYSTLAEYYDRVYHTKDYGREARRILRLAEENLGRRPRSLLDVACGTGRHLAEFARRVSVAGVDLRPEMIRVARRRLGPDVPLAVGDMRAFELGRTFDVVTCLFSAIGYLETPRDRERALGAFYRHLVPGGVALVEGWVRPSRWRGSAVDLDVFDDVDAKVVRVASARREGRHSSVEYHYLVAETGRPIRHFSEVERNPLVETREMLASFRRAGFRAQVLLRGPYLDRGLYIGRRPAPRGAARAPTSGSGSRSARSRPRR